MIGEETNLRQIVRVKPTKILQINARHSVDYVEYNPYSRRESVKSEYFDLARKVTTFLSITKPNY